MGVIKRQGIQQAIISYLGVLIGFASTLWIYSLDEYIYGVARFLLSGASFIGAFAFLGVNSWPIRFFQQFKNEKNGHNGFLPLMLLGSSIAFGLFLILVLLFKAPFLEILDFLDMKPNLYKESFIYIAFLCYLLVMALMLAAYISNFHRIVVPELLMNLLIKISLPILILCYCFGLLYEKGFIHAFIWVHLVVVIGLLAYIIFLKQMTLKINFPFLKKGLLVDMGNYALFSIIGAIGSQLATRLDLLMIASLLPSLGSVGIYALALNIIGVVEIPYRAFSRIASPIIAKENEAQNYKEVLDIYQRSSIGLLIAGLLIFLAVWVSVDQLFLLATNKETLMAGKSVILFLGLAKIIDMATGINGQIIAYSKHYRVNVLAISILAVANIFANYYLIPIYGIIGAAVATFFSLSIFNLFKLIYVWIAFKMQPFKWSSLKVLLLAGITFGLASFLPVTKYPLINIVIKSGFYTATFLGGAIYFKLSSDLTNLFLEYWKKVKDLLRTTS